MDRRTFLAVSAAVAASGSVLPSDAYGVSNFLGEATRLRPDALELRWWNSSKPVRVLVSTDPDASRAAMRVLGEAVRGDRLEVEMGVTPRPYFLLHSGAQLYRTAERRLPVAGAPNFRDLGGYRAIDGRQVRWGKLYRSNSLAGLTTEDENYLRRLSVRMCCDLRSVQERSREPSFFASAADLRLIAFDYDFDFSQSLPAAAIADSTAAVAFLAASYLNIAQTLVPHISALFQLLIEEQTPLVFNCSAGKDRTGIAAAMILSVLGVPRSTVVSDYALSERFVPPEIYLNVLSDNAVGEASSLANVPTPVLRVLFGSPSEVLMQSLALIDSEFGGPVAFAKRYYGLVDADIDQLRAKYLI